MRLSVKYGIAAGLLSGSLFYSEYFTGMFETSNGLYSLLLSFLILIMFIFLSIQSQFNHHNNGTPFTVRKGIKEGMVVTALTAIILAVFTYVFFWAIAPEILENTIAVNEEYIREKNLSEEETQKRIDGLHTMASPFIESSKAIFRTMIMGGLSSLVLALVVVKNPFRTR